VVFSEAPGSDEICPICFWQDDIVQLRWPEFAGGANRPSLIDAQGSVPRVGAIEERFLPYVRPAEPSEPVDPAWRPFDRSRDTLEEWKPGVDYGSTYVEDGTAYYYWSETSS
jgi:hypothetical protein